MKTDNRGVSLVEVLVVIGIMAILASLTASAAGYLTRGNVKKASKTVYSMLVASRTDSMAKSGTWVLTFSQNPEGRFQLESSVTDLVLSGGTTYSGSDEKQMLEKNITGLSVAGVAVDASTPIAIEFAKNTGAVSRIYVVGGSDIKATTDLAGYADVVITAYGNTFTNRLYYLTGDVEQNPTD